MTMARTLTLANAVALVVSGVVLLALLTDAPDPVCGSAVSGPLYAEPAALAVLLWGLASFAVAAAARIAGRRDAVQRLWANRALGFAAGITLAGFAAAAVVVANWICWA
jgi:hypothetical protein